MAHQKSDRSYVDKSEVAFCGFVVAGCDATGIFELVEAPLDQVFSR
ncbi:hypothetical protein SAMN04488118_10684 [Epibacterium ulvae]|uniref:Uncharacterized protein n=1 Tax=Epibacterium ulvae TaxID=1156985 RepID=A0A1G5QVF9_9RHOB|nr:hypothetical protein SAMN04488118_10684 [Epibacterium ulvae]